MKIFLIILITILAISAILLVINGIYCNNTLEVINYRLTSDKLETKLHFVVIADQHNKEFGENNSELVAKIKEQNPDFIAVCGDMVTRYITDDSVMKAFLSQASQIAPTYCVLGNHERDLSDRIDFAAEYNGTGAVLLDNESIRFEKDGESVLIGGLSANPDIEDNVEERDFLENFKELSASSYSILLNHQPEYVENITDGSSVDLVLCGHTHGGLVRIPFIGGVIAPNQGLFPKYDKGEFDFDDTKMIITSGLSNSNPVPRINNCAEITVIDVN